MFGKIISYQLMKGILLFLFFLSIIFPRCNLNIFDIINFTDAGLQDDNPSNGPAVRQGNMGYELYFILRGHLLVQNSINLTT